MHPVKKVPKEGTKIRALYDLFMANKGIPVIVQIQARLKDDLNDFYGLDVQCLSKKGPTWCLVGEFIGKDYVRYYRP